MLDEVEKAKIRVEEEYRFEVRSKLEEKSQKNVFSRLWGLLNSAFGLWLLTAICITWLGNIYTQRQNARAEMLKKEDATRTEELKNKELIERLDLETAYRLSQIQVRLYSLTIPKGSKFAAPVKESPKDGVVKILNSISLPPGKEYFALYPEFSNFSLLALVAELRRHVEGEEHDELHHVLEDLSGIYVLMEVEKVDLSNAERVGGAMYKRIISPRWVQGFYFLDCSEKSPFC